MDPDKVLASALISKGVISPQVWTQFLEQRALGRVTDFSAYLEQLKQQAESVNQSGYKPRTEKLTDPHVNDSLISTPQQSTMGSWIGVPKTDKLAPSEVMDSNIGAMNVGRFDSFAGSAKKTEKLAVSATMDSNPRMNTEAVSVLGQYQVIKQVGAGGYGSVFKALNGEGEIVAVKLLQNETRESLARFDREARLLLVLGREAGFVPIVDWGSSRLGPYIVMPFIPGGTLSQRLNKEGAFELETFYKLALKMAQSVARAHARGIIHRDLKPDNVLFADDDTPLISDLGLAKYFGGGDGSGSGSTGDSVSVMGQGFGTVGYMAPEQIHNAKAVRPTADVFSLASIFYGMITGRPCFSGANSYEVAKRTSRGEYTGILKLRPDCPKPLANFIQDCLNVDPFERPASDAGQMVEALEAISQSKSLEEGTSKVLVATLIFAAVVVLGAVLFVLRPDNTRPPQPPKKKRIDTATADPKISDPAKQTQQQPEIKNKPETPETKRAEVVDIQWPEPTLNIPIQFKKTNNYRLSSIIGTNISTHLGMISDVHFSRDGQTVISIDIGGLVLISDRRTGKPVQFFQRKTDEQCLASAQSHSGRYLVLGGAGKEISIVDFTKNSIKAYSTRFRRTEDFYFSESDEYLYVVGNGGMAVYRMGEFDTPDVEDVSIQSIKRIWPRPDEQGNATSELYLLGKNQLSLWDANKKQTVNDYGLEELGVTKRPVCATSIDANTVAIAFLDGTLIVWNTEQQKILWQTAIQVQQLDPRYPRVRDLYYSRQDQELAVATHHGQIIFYDGKQGHVISKITPHASWIHCLAYDRDQNQFLSGGNDARIMLFDNQRKPIWNYARHLSWVMDSVHDPVSQTLVSVGVDQYFLRFSLNNGKVLGRSYLKTLPRNISLSENGYGLGVIGKKNDVNILDLRHKKAFGYISPLPISAFTRSNDALFLAAANGVIARMAFDGKPREYRCGNNPGMALIANENKKSLTVIDAQGCIWRVPLDFSTPPKNLKNVKLPAVRYARNWTDNSGIEKYAVMTGDSTLWIVPLDQSPPKRWFRVPEAQNIRNFDATQNGKFLALLYGNNRVDLFDIKRRKKIDSFEIGKPSVKHSALYSLEVSEDGENVFIGTGSGLIYHFKRP